MGFSGGGDSGVSAHLHTNAIGDGGSLDTTSLINDMPLFTLVVSQ
tara:strand:- start:303 stop:437 length:135 start_codon:yes stop_codon:yes gene_type:complete